MYENQAASLQGTVLPQWGGLYSTSNAHNKVFVSILEDVGPPAVYEVDDAEDGPLSRSKYGYEILDLFNKLHASGIAQRDVEKRHIRFGNGFARHDPDGGASRPPGTNLGLRLIDLDQASVDPKSVKFERRWVRGWLGFAPEQL